jgi:hypothetical protein
MELNTLYEHLYDLGTKLQTEACFDILHEGFRPWPHVYKNKGRSRQFYKAVDRNLSDDLQRIGLNKDREDYDKYETIMRAVFKCFGLGIIDSLEFTMKDYLKQTDGDKQNANREDWEIKAVEKMVCHNNFAERPFAVLKAFARMYPTLSLENLSWLTHCIVNGTHRCAEVYGKVTKQTPVNARMAGIALTAHPALKRAVNELCSVRKRTLGRVTGLVREARKLDKVAQVANRKRKATDKHEAQIRKQARTAASRDKAEETATNSLVRDVEELDVQLKARGNNKDSRVTYLKELIYARIAGENPRLYPGLGDEWRKQGGKIRISATCKNQTAEDYLSKLLSAMLKEDSQTCGINDTNRAFHTQDYIRVVPSIALDFTNPKAIAYKKEFSKQIADLATPIDDPTYIELHRKYNGAILFDNETRATQKLFRIAAIQFVRSFTANRHSCWEATCEPVYRDPKSQQYLVPHELTVPGNFS